MAKYSAGKGVSGAASGAMMGAALGPWGMLGGAALGALGGFGGSGGSGGKEGQYAMFEPPPFVGGSFYRGDEKLADVQKSGKNINVTYNETPEQKQQRVWRQGSFYGAEKTVGNPYPEQMNRWTQIADYRKNRALDAYDEQNTPAWQKFVTDSYDRFGGLNNTQSVVGFNEIDKSRNKYRQELASEYDYNIEALGQQEDNRLMDLAKFLQYNQNYEDTLMNNFITQAYNASTLGNTQALGSSAQIPALYTVNQDMLKTQQQQTNDTIAGIGNIAAIISMFGKNNSGSGGAGNAVKVNQAY